VRFTDEKRYFVSEASVYRLLKAHDLITSPAYVVIKAADEFQDKTTARTSSGRPTSPISRSSGWGWYYLSTVLDDFSRYIIAWKLCTNMRAEDVTDTLDLALKASGLRQRQGAAQAQAAQRQWAQLHRGRTGGMACRQSMAMSAARPCHPQTQGKIERWHQTLKNRILLDNYFLPGDLEAQIEAFVEHYNHPATTRA
jgi:putative transposase